MLYAARYPLRLNKLVIVDPSLRATGLASDLRVEEVIAERAAEPWHSDALAALTAEASTPEQLEGYRYRSAPFLYGQWNGVTQAYAAAEPAQFSAAATAGFYQDFEPDPQGLRAALSTLAAPVLLVVGEHDIWPTRMAVAELATLFTDVQVSVQPQAGHFPWVDDGPAFATTVAAFLA